MNRVTSLRAGRPAALLFAGGGAIAIVNAPLARGHAGHEVALFAAGLAAILIGLACWAAPWERWPARANLILCPVALALASLSDVYGHTSPYTYALYYVLVFVWVGLTQRPGAALVLAPAAAMAYVVPVLAGQSRPDMVVSLTGALPVCVLVGETTAWVMQRLARAQTESVSRVAHLEALVGAGAALECTGDPAHLPDEVARVAAAVFDSEQAVVLVGRPRGGMTVVGRHGRAPAGDPLADLDEAFVADVYARAEPAHLAGVLVIPLHASLRTIGAVALLLPRPPDEFVLGLAQVFGSQAGLALERHGAVAHLVGDDVSDPVTGLGTRSHAEALLSALEPGDVVALFKISRAANQDGERLLGPFLLRELRSYDSAAAHDDGAVLVILRNAAATAQAATERLASAWSRANPTVPLLLGWARHRPPSFPADTLATARQHMAPTATRRIAAPWEGTPWAV